MLERYGEIDHQHLFVVDNDDSEVVQHSKHSKVLDDFIKGVDKLLVAGNVEDHEFFEADDEEKVIDFFDSVDFIEFERLFEFEFDDVLGETDVLICLI